MKTVRLLGDSHVLMHLPMESERWLTVHHTGACQAGSLLSPSAATKSFATMRDLLNQWSVVDNWIGFLYGEIDCRVLIWDKHVRTGYSIDAIIYMLAYRYLGAILHWRDRGWDVFIHGVIPACRQPNDYGLEHYASEGDRCSINARFNATMQNIAIKHRIPYFNVFNYPELRNPEDGGMQLHYLLPDRVHIDPNACKINEYFKDWVYVTL